MNKHFNYLKDFISDEHRNFKFKIGNILASSLSGFIAGVVFSSVFWILVILFMKYFPIIFQSKPGL